MSYNQEKVASLSQFIECLKSIQPSKDEIVVYRGHSDVDYELKPGLFRKGNEGLRDKEADLFRDVEAARPMAFINDRTTLDKLVTMQHYGLPTRLLDVTSNPLTALYFAVTSRQEKDGAVLVLKVSKSINKFFDSDTVTCLANLVYLDQKEKNKVRESALKKTAYLRQVGDYIRTQEEDQVLSITPPKNIRNKIHKKFNQYKQKHKGKNIEETFLYLQNKECEKDFNEKPFLKHFLHFIRADKPYFQPLIRPRDLLNVLHVKTKQRNDRITAQNGSFLIFGLMDSITSGFSIEKFLINREAKHNIKKELDSLGINESSLFPELEYYTRHVVDVYKKS